MQAMNTQHILLKYFYNSYYIYLIISVVLAVGMILKVKRTKVSFEKVW